MISKRTIPRHLALAVACLAVLEPMDGSSHDADAHGSGAREERVLEIPLPNLPGQVLTAVIVSYAPGARSPKHHHAGSVFAFVLDGVIRSQNSSSGPLREYRGGQSFFEPPGSVHLVSANGSEREPARLLAVFVADAGSELTTFEE